MKPVSLSEAELIVCLTLDFYENELNYSVEFMYFGVPLL